MINFKPIPAPSDRSKTRPVYLIELELGKKILAFHASRIDFPHPGFVEVWGAWLSKEEVILLKKNPRNQFDKTIENIIFPSNRICAIHNVTHSNKEKLEGENNNG